MVLRKLTSWVDSHKLLTILIVVGLVMLYIGYTELNYAKSATSSPGAMGRNMLQVFPYWGEVIELAYQSDAAPNQASLQAFADFVTAHSGKRPAIVLEEIPSGGPQPLQTCPLPTGCSAGTYTPGDIAYLAKTYWGKVLPWPGQIVVHYLYVDRQSSEGPTVAATSFCATCVVVFKPVASAFGTQGEAAVISHEHGHLWGLCAISYDDVRTHCDGTGHSTNPNSLMYGSLNPNNQQQMSLYLDPNDLADLSDLAWGRL